MGATTTQTVWMVLGPTAMPGILTGIMLATRAAGDGAAAFTALFSNYWLVSQGHATHAAHRVARRADLQLRGNAVRKPGRLARAAALVLVLLALAANLGVSLSSRQIQQA
jgi:ABC-type phosphate transport system permease subunit